MDSETIMLTLYMLIIAHCQGIAQHLGLQIRLVYNTAPNKCRYIKPNHNCPRICKKILIFDFYSRYPFQNHHIWKSNSKAITHLL